MSDHVAAAVRSIPRSRPVIVIDGPAGAGKTRLAARLAAELPGATSVISMDDLYDGWDGPVDPGFAIYLATSLAPQILAGRSITHRRYDWGQGRFGPEVTIPAGDRLIVEGVGAAHPALAGPADLRVWVTADPAIRATRVLERDGEATRPHWAHWLAVQDLYYARHPTQPLCDLTVVTDEG
ncbi:MAG: hypothetical protein U0R64_01410 [Candidatus Nanopelagicales bacterium]